MIFDIQRFSTHDGPGIRTVVFLKGCPLRCPWCENPESQSARVEVFYDPGTCIGCLDCVRAVGNGEISTRKTISQSGEEVLRPVIQRERLHSVERLREVCPSGALRLVGRMAGVEEVMREVEKDLPFYGTGGGVTFSGGEPFAQPRLLAQLMEESFRRGIDIAVETSLQVDWQVVEPLVPYTSLFLADLKHVDPKKYRAAVGGDLSVVIDNFRRLEALGAKVVVRIPVVPGFNEDALGELIEFASSLSNVNEVHLLPYHTMGKRKYELLGREYGMAGLQAPEREDLAGYRETAESLGLEIEIGG